MNTQPFNPNVKRGRLTYRMMVEGSEVTVDSSEKETVIHHDNGSMTFPSRCDVIVTPVNEDTTSIVVVV